MSAADMSAIAGIYNCQWLTAFVAVSILSLLAHFAVRGLFDLQMNHCAKTIVLLELRSRNPGTNVTNAPADLVTAKYQQIHDHFDLGSAAIIGMIERIFYIFAIMFGGAFAVMSGWLVLKAFNTWLEGFEIRSESVDELATSVLSATRRNAALPEIADIAQRAKDAADTRDKAKRMAYYHLYLVGNGLSLAAGIALGFLGLQLAARWPWLFACICH
jgi:hypothetical protein